MTLLRRAYYQNISSIEAIQHDNIAFESDLHLLDIILKTVVLQTSANNNNCTDKCGHKKTFLFRLKQFIVKNNTIAQNYNHKYFSNRFDVNTDLHAFQLVSNITYAGSVHSDDLKVVFFFKIHSFTISIIFRLMHSIL